MKFKLVPVLNQMRSLYQLPRNKQRFDAYLHMLQGEDKEDLILPIAGYNPMGKEDVLLKVETLLGLGAEKIIEECTAFINANLKDDGEIIDVVLNLADDVGGSWSNFCTTDFTSKFQIDALVKRRFCTPFLWTSEEHSPKLIEQRVLEYMYRTAYWLNNKKVITLEDHIKQEIYVRQNVDIPDVRYDIDQKAVEKFYLVHKSSEDYNLIFNFFYGDEASEALSYATYGLAKQSGFEYVNNLFAPRP